MHGSVEGRGPGGAASLCSALPPPPPSSLGAEEQGAPNLASPAPGRQDCPLWCVLQRLWRRQRRRWHQACGKWWPKGGTWPVWTWERATPMGLLVAISLVPHFFVSNGRNICMFANCMPPLLNKMDQLNIFNE